MRKETKKLQGKSPKKIIFAVALVTIVIVAQAFGIQTEQFLGPAIKVIQLVSLFV